MSYSISEYIDLLVGGVFIKEKHIKNDFVEVIYCDTYEEYRNIKPKSKLPKEEFLRYFSTGDKVAKILLTEPIRLLRQFPELKRVGLRIKGYTFFADKEVVNNLLNINIEQLSLDDGTWIDFVNNYTYNKNNRHMFLESLKKFSDDVLEKSREKGIQVSEQLQWISNEMKKENIIVDLNGKLRYIDRPITKGRSET